MSTQTGSSEKAWTTSLKKVETKRENRERGKRESHFSTWLDMYAQFPVLALSLSLFSSLILTGNVYYESKREIKCITKHKVVWQKTWSFDKVGNFICFFKNKERYLVHQFRRSIKFGEEKQVTKRAEQWQKWVSQWVKLYDKIRFQKININSQNIIEIKSFFWK